MAKDLSNATGIGTDSDFLNGNLVDLQTLFDEHIYQDIVQFHQKNMHDAGISPNGNFDNEANEYQLIDALKHQNAMKKINPSTFSLTSASDDLEVVVREGNFIIIDSNNPNFAINTIKPVKTAGGDAIPFGYELYIQVEWGSRDIKINRALVDDRIVLPYGEIALVPGTIAKFIYKDIDDGDPAWSLISSSIEPLFLHWDQIGTSGVYYRKKGENQVDVRTDGIVSLSNFPLTGLPEGYRPASESLGVGAFSDTGVFTSTFSNIVIRPDGDILAYNISPGEDGITFNFSFPLVRT